MQDVSHIKMNIEVIELAKTLWREEREDEAIAPLLPLVKEGDTVAKANLGLIYCYYFRGEKPIKTQESEALLVEACEEGEASAYADTRKNGTHWRFSHRMQLTLLQSLRRPCKVLKRV